MTALIQGPTLVMTLASSLYCSFATVAVVPLSEGPASFIVSELMLSSIPSYLVYVEPSSRWACSLFGHVLTWFKNECLP